MMRVLVIGLAVVLAAGCSGALDPAEIKACEESVLAQLKTPATYKRVSASSTKIEDRKTRYQSVSVVYDAQNTYGALVRETQICAYPVAGTDIRTDLFDSGAGGELGEALNGEGLFSPKAQLPSRAQREAERAREIDAMMNRIEHDNAVINTGYGAYVEATADRLEALAENPR